MENGLVVGDDWCATSLIRDAQVLTPQLMIWVKTAIQQPITLRPRPKKSQRDQSVQVSEPHNTILLCPWVPALYYKLRPIHQC